MAAVRPPELKPGLVIQLDPDRMRTLGGCKRTLGSTGYAVHGPQPFLIFDVSFKKRRILTVPLFSNETNTRVLLTPALKKQTIDQPRGKWFTDNSYATVRQVWSIPIQMMEQVSVIEISAPNQRRTYDLAGDQDMVHLLSIAASGNFIDEVPPPVLAPALEMTSKPRPRLTVVGNQAVAVAIAEAPPEPPREPDVIPVQAAATVPARDPVEDALVDEYRHRLAAEPGFLDYMLRRYVQLTRRPA